MLNLPLNMLPVTLTNGQRDQWQFDMFVWLTLSVDHIPRIAELTKPWSVQIEIELNQKKEFSLSVVNSHRWGMKFAHV